jgi:hypothetical protein
MINPGFETRLAKYAQQRNKPLPPLSKEVMEKFYAVKKKIGISDEI